MPSILEKFDLPEMLRCSNALRRLTRDATSIETAAQVVCRYLYDELMASDGRRACALVRCYKVHDYGGLPEDLQEFVRAQLSANYAAAPELRCLTLMATVGDLPEWNDRRRSAGHRAIPLPNAGVIERAPMIAQLFRALGVELSRVVAPAADIVPDLEGRSYGVFFVPDARGSKHIPAQDFVEGHGIQSVIGFGGALVTGDLFAVILFTRVRVPESAAARFRTLALDVKGSLFLHHQTFDSQPPSSQPA